MLFWNYHLVKKNFYFASSSNIFFNTTGLQSSCLFYPLQRPSFKPNMLVVCGTMIKKNHWFTTDITCILIHSHIFRKNQTFKDSTYKCFERTKKIIHTIQFYIYMWIQRFGGNLTLYIKVNTVYVLYEEIFISAAVVTLTYAVTASRLLHYYHFSWKRP